MADTLAVNPLTGDVLAPVIDAVLALLAVYFLRGKERAALATSPWLRVPQRWCADVTCAWLVDRQGWR
jgi:hypothetical protein